MGRDQEAGQWTRGTRLLLMRVLLSVVTGAGSGTAQVSQSLLDRVARLDVEDVTLEVALRSLRRSSGVAIAFSPDRLPPERRVTCHCTELTLRAALDQLLEGTDLQYRAGRRQILIGRLTTLRQAASGVLDGRILLSPDGGPVTQAEVVITRVVGSADAPSDRSAAPQAIWADSDGRFTVTLSPGRYGVAVEAPGFGGQPLTQADVRAGETTHVTIRLEVMPIPLEELVVTASTFGMLRTRGPSGQVLSRANLESQPHPGNDIVRAVQRLPGISNTDYSAKPLIRGARANEVLTILDGLELHDPYHLKYWDGSLSIVDVETVSEVSVITGGFTTEYGDKSAAVLAMRSAEPPVEGMRTTVGLDFMSSIVKSEGAFGDGKGSWLASARKGFLAFVFDLMNLYSDEDLSPSYYDVFSRVRYELAPGQRLSAHVLHAGDENHGTEADSTVYGLRYGSSYGWLNWEADLSPTLSARTVASIGRMSQNREGADYWSPGGSPTLEVDDEITTWELGLRQDWQLRRSERMLLKWGFDLLRGRSEYHYFRSNFSYVPNLIDPGGPDFWPQHDTVSVETSVSGYDAGAYLAGRARITDALTVEVGLRYDHQSHTGERQISPRINGALQVAARTFIRGAWGYYHQPHARHELWTADADTAFYPTQKAEHRVLGLEHIFRNGMSLRLEGYQRLLSDPLPEYRRLARNMGPLWEESLADRVMVHPEEGRARGVELFLKASPGGRLTWSASYSLSKAEEEVSGMWVPRPYDQRHALNLQIAFHPTPDWTIAAGWVYHSAWPYTRIHYQPGETIWGHPVAFRQAETLNQGRLPPYWRTDFRASRRLTVGGNDLLAYVDVFNVLDRENGLDYEQTAWWTGNRWISGESLYPQLPLLPSLGLRWIF